MNLQYISQSKKVRYLRKKEKAHHEDDPYGMGRLAAAKLFPLSAGFHNVTGLELDGEPVGMHGYFLDPVPY